HWLYTIPLRLRSLFRSRRVDQELNEELQFHLERKIEEGIAGGLSPDEARYAALRAMDGLEQRKEEMRTMRQVRWLTDFVADVHYAIRSLRRTPGLTAFVVITIALGIGMTTSPFCMLDALIFRPYPVPRPGSGPGCWSRETISGSSAWSRRRGAVSGTRKTRCQGAMRSWCSGRASGSTSSAAIRPSSAGWSA